MTDTLKALLPTGAELTWPDDKPHIERITRSTIVGEPTFITTNEGVLMTVEAIRLTSNDPDPI